MAQPQNTDFAKSLNFSLRPKSQTEVWDRIDMKNVLNHVSERSSHLAGKRRKN